MNIARSLPFLLSGLLATTAWAQSSGKPLNLKLPPGDLPAASATVTTPARAAPGVYYGDTSGRMGNTTRDSAVAGNDDCDDFTYNRPQVHGSVGMGVVSGSRFGGNFQTGSVNLRQAFGSCDRPTGGISISVGGGTGRFHGRGH